MNNCSFKRTHPYSHDSKSWSIVTILIITIISSAFGVIYFQDVHRRLLIESQKLAHQRSLLQIEQGKRLLEHGVLAGEPRIEQLARKLLNMHAPRAADITLISAKPSS